MAKKKKVLNLLNKQHIKKKKITLSDAQGKLPGISTKFFKHLTWNLLHYTFFMP